MSFMCLGVLRLPPFKSCIVAGCTACLWQCTGPVIFSSGEPVSTRATRSWVQPQGERQVGSAAATTESGQQRVAVQEGVLGGLPCPGQCHCQVLQGAQVSLLLLSADMLFVGSA